MAIPLTRSLTPQTARKAVVPKGCVNNERSRRCTPWLRTSSTTCVVCLVIISFLTATRFMADLIRGSLILSIALNQHGVAIAEKTVTLLDGMLVGRPDMVQSGKG